MNKTLLDNRTSGVAGSLSLVVVPHAGRREWYATATAIPGETLSQLRRRVLERISAEDASVVSQEIFLASSDSFNAEFEKETEWPITWVIEDKPSQPKGMRIRTWAISGARVHPVSLGNTTLGSMFEDDYFRYLRLGGLLPPRTSASPSDQAFGVLLRMEDGLQEAGMNFGNVVRTWYFNRDILSWYPEFNRSRDKFFQDRKVFEGLVPASTGIGGGNPFGAELTAGLLAVQPKSDQGSVSAVLSPLQNSALDYGSSFSRAARVMTPEGKRLFVSGTASIGPDGKTRHLGDLNAQSDWTLRVVREILASQQMGWEDVVRSHVYLRHAGEVSDCVGRLTERGLDPRSLIATCQTVCREDLLFEIEVDAIASNR